MFITLADMVAHEVDALVDDPESKIIIVLIDQDRMAKEIVNRLTNGGEIDLQSRTFIRYTNGTQVRLVNARVNDDMLRMGEQEDVIIDGRTG